MAKQRLFYTFGNHMHWTDMQWLWGYDVLPASVRDMLRLIEATGAKGNVNFDAVGYERMAAECPEALAELRAAVRAGRIEVVGGSYGQPYGLFHGGESNVRQRIYGVRAIQRLFGVRPRTFWEEEFDFFPQLPQILARCGFRGASLFFQWTWATPSVPEEPLALVQWEGLDGTRIPTLPKNELCLHQWPEDFEGRLDSGLIRALAKPAIVQWLELFPSPDWMCRSELLLPRLAELFGDARFELVPVTLGELIAEQELASAPVRRYGLDDVFHGVSLGKNGDNMPRWSRACEEQLLAAESLSALCGLFGRPYPSWDVYPTWELEEAWRDLLSAQHHDNHECEGLCGSIGLRSFERSLGLSNEVYARALERLALRVQADAGSQLVFNVLGWTRDIALEDGSIARAVPGYGYRVVEPEEGEPEEPQAVEMEEQEQTITLARGDFAAVIDKKHGTVKQIHSHEFDQGLLHPRRPIGELEMQLEGKPERFKTVSLAEDEEEFAEVTFLREGRYGSRLRISYHVAPLYDALGVHVECESLARPDGGMHAGLATPIEPAFGDFELVHDHPYGVAPIRADKDHVRKYPTGDWMTSKQVFEAVKKPFTAYSFVDLLQTGHNGRGLLVVHDGGQAYFRSEHGIQALMTAYDPWDEEYFLDAFTADYWLLPHGALTNGQRMRAALELTVGSPRFADSAVTGGEGDLPPIFGALATDAENVLVTAFYRESQKAAEHLPRHFAREVRDPFVVRLVEFDGVPATVNLRVPGSVAKAARTDLMGEVEEPLSAEPASAPFGPDGFPWSRVRFAMKPYEIATIMLDLELGRWNPRNLDEHRHVWATVHRRGKS